jgi:hypothetical protein
MNKVKCFACHKFGDYVGQCPNEKKKQVVSAIDVEEFTHKFKKEYSFLVCLSSRASSTSIWYIDSGTSLHMISVHEYFIDLTKIGDLELVVRDDLVAKEIGSGIISFQRESLPPMLLRDVLYVLVLKKNLVSVSTIEHRGYEVLFHDEDVFLYPKGSRITSTKLIGIMHDKLYKIMFQPNRALMHSTNNNDLCELWHRRMAHFHHGDLRILKEIVIE